MKRPRPAVLTAAKEPPTGAVRAAAVAIAAEIEVVEFVADHWTVAVDAFLAYGNGRHRAGLNCGDGMTYAIAKLAGGPLLCLGNDFPATDLELA